MAQVAEIIREHTSSGVPNNYEKEVEITELIKWSAKMKGSFEQAKNGEFYEVDVKNFWNVEENDGDSHEEIVANLKQAAKDLILIKEGKLKCRPARELLKEEQGICFMI